MDGIQVYPDNPNNKAGGFGCLVVGNVHSLECKGPWIQFYRVSTEHDQSPYAVICAHHLAQVSRAFKRMEPQAAEEALAGFSEVHRGLIDHGPERP